MKASTIHQIKKELSFHEPAQLIDNLLRLARYKKENKELLTYLLFEMDNETGFVESIKEEIDEQFDDINSNNFYWAKKSIRKILRNINKYIRFSGKKETELILLIYFCTKLKTAGLVYRGSVHINNIYERQLKKVHQAMDKLDEDLRYDYLQDVTHLEKS